MAASGTLSPTCCPLNRAAAWKREEQLLALFRVPTVMNWYCLRWWSAHISLLAHIDARDFPSKAILVTRTGSAGRRLGVRADASRRRVWRVSMPIFYPPAMLLIGCVVGPCCIAQPDGLLNMREPLQVGAGKCEWFCRTSVATSSW